MPRIFTHVFVHRTHFLIFGRLFPTAFHNWWSDDWISHVYGSRYVSLSLSLPSVERTFSFNESRITRVTLCLLPPPPPLAPVYFFPSHHRSNTFVHTDAQVTHKTAAQKSGPKVERYTVDTTDGDKLEVEVKKGGGVIKTWLATQGIDAPIHVTCGYTTPGDANPMLHDTVAADGGGTDETHRQF